MCNKRFTPAYAGNTYPETKKATELKVHPRIRGEYSGSSQKRPQEAGSPPHTRGILTFTAQTLPFPRFTPAYAGNT